MLLHFKPGTKPGLEKIMIFMKTSKKLDSFYLNQVFFIQMGFFFYNTVIIAKTVGWSSQPLQSN
jgi:hypothetical protein